MIIQYIISIINIIFIKNNIIIPFYTKEEKLENLSHNSLMTKMFPNKIETKINIGTPNQEIPLRIKLLRYPISISSKSLNYFKIEKFDEKNSSTYISLDIRENYYGYQDFQLAKKSKDNIFLNNNNITLNNFTFFLATMELQNYMESGVLGLRIPDNNYRTIDVNFIKQLKERNLINSYNFFIRYLNEKEGELIIGNLPHEINDNIFNENNFIEFKATIISDSLGFCFKDSFFGNILIESDFKGELAIEDNFIRGDNSFKNILVKHFFQIYFDRKICFNSSFDYLEFKKNDFFYCNKNINLSEFQNINFTVKDTNFEILFESKDLFFEYNDYYYFVIYFPQISYNYNHFRLGKPFFKKYLITFNQDKKMIGYYKTIIKEKNINFNINKKYIPWIITIISVIGMLIMGFYILYYRPFRLRKKRANELEDEYDYISDNNNKNKNDYFSINEQN